MKNYIRALFVGLAILAGIIRIHATTAFPVANNLSLFEFSAGISSGGTNYLVAMEVGTNVVGQLVSTNGTLQGPQIVVGSNAGNLPPNLALAFGQANYLLAWSDNSVSSGVDMFGQFISRSGVKVGPKFNLLQAQGLHGFQYVMALASDGTNFLVVWADGYNSETESSGNIYGQLVAPAGTLTGSEFVISSQGQNGNSAAATFGKANYLVVWQSNNNDTGNDNKTFGEFVSPGGLAGSPIQIGQTPAPDQSTVAVAFDGTNYLAAWNWDPYPETEEMVTNWEIFGRLISPAGTFPGNELQLVTDAGNDEIPSLAFDGANYLLSWSFGFDVITNSTIRFQFFNRKASAITPEFTLFTAQATNAPLLAINGLTFGGSQYAAAATLGTITTDINGNLNGIPSSEVYGGFLSPSLANSFSPPPPRITSFQHSGSLTWTNVSGTNAFILETASALAGPWSYAAPPLDLTISSNTQTTVPAPLVTSKGFYFLQQGFSSQTFHGTWLAPQAGTTNIGSIYFVSDGNGTLTNVGGFNFETPPGSYDVNGNDTVSFILNGIEDGVINFSGQFLPPREIVLSGPVTNLATAIFPVQNVSLCAGVWSGTLTETNGNSNEFPINLTVTTNGAVTLSGSYSGSGWVFALAATNGAGSGFFHTSASGPYDQIQLDGTLTGNVLSGTYSVDNGNEAEGTFTLTR